MFGGDIEEYRYRIEQSKALAGKITSSPFNRKGTEIIYMERWISSVGYCLPITQFNNKQCDEIQRPFYNAILPKMGFNRHFPRAVIFGPKQPHGKQMTNYETVQYVSHLERFVGYVWQDNEMGNLMRIQMDQE